MKRVCVLDFGRIAHFPLIWRADERPFFALWKFPVKKEGWWKEIGSKRFFEPLLAAFWKQSGSKRPKKGRIGFEQPNGPRSYNSLKSRSGSKSLNWVQILLAPKCLGFNNIDLL